MGKGKKVWLQAGGSLGVVWVVYDRWVGWVGKPVCKKSKTSTNKGKLGPLKSKPMPTLALAERPKEHGSSIKDSRSVLGD